SSRSNRLISRVAESSIVICFFLRKRRQGQRTRRRRYRERRSGIHVGLPRHRRIETGHLELLRSWTKPDGTGHHQTLPFLLRGCHSVAALHLRIKRLPTSQNGYVLHHQIIVVVVLVTSHRSQIITAGSLHVLRIIRNRFPRHRRLRLGPLLSSLIRFVIPNRRLPVWFMITIIRVSISIVSPARTHRRIQSDPIGQTILRA
ncbi:hypothetical protein OWV82_005822, partial [Melia azedarach]